MQAACYAVIIASERFALGFDNSRLSRLSAGDLSWSPKLRVDQIRPIAYLIGGWEAQREGQCQVGKRASGSKKSTALVSAQRVSTGAGDGKLGWASFAPLDDPHHPLRRNCTVSF